MTRSTRRRRQFPRFGSGLQTARAVVALALPPAMLTGCGRSDPSSPTVPLIPTAVSSLVGAWDGMLRQPQHDEHELTMVLRADSTIMVAMPGFTARCDATGVWTVSRGVMTVSAHDGCDRALVTFVAPVAATRMLGTWSIGPGEQGSFELAKR